MNILFLELSLFTFQSIEISLVILQCGLIAIFLFLKLFDNFILIYLFLCLFDLKLINIFVNEVIQLVVKFLNHVSDSLVFSGEFVHAKIFKDWLLIIWTVLFGELRVFVWAVILLLFDFCSGICRTVIRSGTTSRSNSSWYISFFS